LNKESEIISCNQYRLANIFYKKERRTAMADFKAESAFGAGIGNFGFIIFLIFILIIFGVGFFGGYI